jgi:hypothetical protein
VTKARSSSGDHHRWLLHSEPGAVDHVGDIALDLPALDRIDQRLVDQAVHVRERLRCDAVVAVGGAVLVATGDAGGRTPTSTLALSLQTVVEPIEIGWCELLQRDMAEVGDDVGADVGSVLQVDGATVPRCPHAVAAPGLRDGSHSSSSHWRMVSLSGAA